MKNRSLPFCITLSIITFGIYYLCWLYSVSKEVIDEFDSLFSSTFELNDPVTKNPEGTEGLFSKVMSWLGGSADSNVDLKYSALEAMGYSNKDVDQLIKNEEETYKQLGYSKKEIAEIRKL